MKKRRFGFLILAALAGLCLLGALFVGSDEPEPPVFDGMSLRECVT